MGGFVTNLGCFSLIWGSFYVKLVFWESARPGPARKNFRPKSARPGPGEFSAQVGPARPGPEEFSAQVGPARPGGIFGPSRPGPARRNFRPSRPGPARRNFQTESARPGPARSKMAEISNTGPQQLKFRWPLSGDPGCKVWSWRSGRGSELEVRTANLEA